MKQDARNGGKEIREKDAFGARESSFTTRLKDSWAPPKDVPLFLAGVIDARSHQLQEHHPCHHCCLLHSHMHQVPVAQEHPPEVVHLSPAKLNPKLSFL